MCLVMLCISVMTLMCSRENPTTPGKSRLSLKSRHSGNFLSFCTVSVSSFKVRAYFSPTTTLVCLEWISFMHPPRRHLIFSSRLTLSAYPGRTILALLANRYFGPFAGCGEELSADPVLRRRECPRSLTCRVRRYVYPIQATNTLST
jgi:hypothetical protein